MNEPSFRKIDIIMDNDHVNISIYCFGKTLELCNEYIQYLEYYSGMSGEAKEVSLDHWVFLIGYKW